MTSHTKQNSLERLPDTPYWTAFQGRFYGLLKWEDVDAFWGILSNQKNWFINDLTELPPDETANTETYSAFLSTAKTLINSRRDMSMCGAIYTDNQHSPTFVKIFDPSNMGSACSTSSTRTLPRWVLSTIPAEPYPAPTMPATKPSFFARLFKT